MQREAPPAEPNADSVIAASSIDIFIPPFYRSSSIIHHAYPNVIATVDYSAAAEGGGYGSSSSNYNYEHHGSVSVHYAPYVLRHRTETASGGDGGGGDVFAAAVGAPGGRSEEPKASAKQGLMEVLLGNAAAGEALLSDVGRALPAPSLVEEVQHRLRGVRCDATYVTSPQLLVTLVRTILAKRTDPVRTQVDCVAAIDLSHTQLGRVTREGPPLHFDSNGNAVPPPPDTITTRFYPDENLRRETTPEEVQKRVAERSLALTYVAPLLFTPGMRLYRIRELVCSHCALTDQDAHALAVILKLGGGSGSGSGSNGASGGSAKHRGPAAFFRRKGSDGQAALSCSLETLDISFNEITDAGMTEIRKALRHNRRLTSLVVAGNPLRYREKVVDGIERQLRRNREGKSSVSWMHLQHWKRLISKSQR